MLTLVTFCIVLFNWFFSVYLTAYVAVKYSVWFNLQYLINLTTIQIMAICLLIQAAYFMLISKLEVPKEPQDKEKTFSDAITRSFSRMFLFGSILLFGYILKSCQ
jgi:membrane-bound acyltransferase YfiQ involved in biofilm formation